MKLAAADGEILWLDHRDGDSGMDDSGWDIVIGTDDHPIITGISGTGDGEADYYTAKLATADGQIIWDTALPGAVFNLSVRAGWLALMDNGDVVMANRTWNSDTGNDVVVHRYAAADGELDWEIRYTSDGFVSDQVNTMVRDAAGDILIAGVTRFSYDYLVLKLNGDDGTERWHSIYEGPVFFDSATSIVEGPGGCVIASGYSDGEGSGWDLATVGFDPIDGEQLWDLRFTSEVAYGSDEARAMAVSPQGDLYVVGYSYNENWDSDMIAVRYRIPAVETGVGDLPLAGVSAGFVAAYPNPFNPRITLAFALPQDGPARLSVVDLRGRSVALVHDGSLAAGEHQVSWDGRGHDGRVVGAGVYLAVLESAGLRLSRKIVLAK